MADRPEPQRLLHAILDDALAESSPPDFRAALLGETLRLARRRRRWRQTRSAAGVLIVAALALSFVLENQPEKPVVARPPTRLPVPQSYRLVITQPLPAGAVIASDRFFPVKMVTSTLTVTCIATTRGSFHPVNDEQLLVLFGPRPPVLIRTGPDSEELLFAGASGQKDSPPR